VRNHRRATLVPGRWPGALLMLLLPVLAQAHAGAGDTGLMNGLMHPVFGLDHLLAMISVGVLSAQLGGHNLWRIPAAFVGAMTLGGALGIARVAQLDVELGIALSVLVLGLGVVFAQRHMSAWTMTALVLFFGACHGYAHGIEIPKSVSPALYTLGFVISTSVLHIAGLLIGELASMQAWLWKGVRLSGGLVSASGLMFLWQTLAGTA
jgi:urease accessory protein